MKRLLLLRHAKSSWDHPAMADFDRPLNARGVKAAALMGQYLADSALTPDRIICSTAARTRATLAGMLPSLPGEGDICMRRAIYEAMPEAILKTVRADGAAAETLLVIGHNPGLQETALLLLPREAGPGRAAIADHFPTAALAVLECDIADWKSLLTGSAGLGDFVTPRGLEAAETVVDGP